MNLERIITDPIYGIETMFSVLTEEERVLTPFILRPAQRAAIRIEQAALERGIRKILIPKARRHGITTVQQARSLHLCCTKEYAKCGTLAHREESTKSIFRDLALVMYDSIPSEIKPVRDGYGMSILKLRDMHSEFVFATAGGSDPFRGETFSRIHVSEAAFIDTLSENRRALHSAARNGIYVEESTGNGCVGAFYNSCMETNERGEMIEPGMWIGSNNYAMLFLPWFLDPRNNRKVNGVIVPDEPRHGEVAAQCQGESELIEVAKREYGFEITSGHLEWRRENRADGDQRTGFQQEFPEVLEDCFLSTSQSRFDSHCIQAGRKRCKEPIRAERTGYGEFLIWDDPKQMQLYVIGVDVAEGVDGGDYTYITVHERESTRQVASWHGYCSPEEAAKIASDIGISYNYAMVACERNNHGHAFHLALLDKYRYTNVYYGDDLRPGWNNNKQSRTVLIDDLASHVHSWYDTAIICDIGFWRECLTFERQNNGKYEAKRPNHDDRVIAVGIALMACRVPLVREVWTEGHDGFWT